MRNRRRRDTKSGRVKTDRPGAAVCAGKERVMSVRGLAKFWFTTPVVALMALQGGQVQAQKFQAQEIQPVNSGANPYRVIRNWGTEPEGRPWGAANGVAIDRDGMSVWVADRCGNGNGCVGSTVDPIQKFDPSGKR